MKEQKKPREPWVMPNWMEEYRIDICNTGGNPIEELMNDKESNMHNNQVRMILIFCVQSQISLLHQLHKKGLLL